METIPPTTSVTSSSTRTWCILCHASALLGLFFHFLGHIFGPLIVWILKRAEAAEIDAHGKESLNFQISMLIYDAIAVILCFVLIGIPILIALWVANTVLVIIASVKASEGKFYQYPFTIRLIKSRGCYGLLTSPNRRHGHSLLPSSARSLPFGVSSPFGILL